MWSQLGIFSFSILVSLLLNGKDVFGIDLNSAIPRTNCYTNKQENCNESFIDKYKNLSLAATDTTYADTYFLLFNREIPDKPEKLHECGGMLPPDTKFNRKGRLIVLIVSFVFGYCDTAAFREWAVQILEREDCNILAVDYSWGQHIEVTETYVNDIIVAEQTTIVLKNIQKQTGITKDKLYLVGFSLGAQVAGLIGYRMPIGRITGLDPGGAAYKQSLPASQRLDPSDADLVDVYHTGMGECLPYLSINYPAGHVDIYFNGGQVQNACYKHGYISIVKGDFVYGVASVIYPQACWHLMATQYYKVSINPGQCQFVGVKCSSYEKFKQGKCSCGKNGKKCVIAGFDFDKYYNRTSQKFPQKYYVKTTLDCPYCDNNSTKLRGFKQTYESSLQPPHD